jgi:drug/metabolite transporter (DMT)-like permease
MSFADWLMLVALSLLWGGSFFLNKIAVAEVPPLAVALARVAIAAVILLAIAASRGELRMLVGAWPAFLALGLVNSALPFALIAWSQTHIASGLASILNATTPLFALLAANAVTRDDKLTRGRAVGLVFGLIGVATMVGPGALSGFGLHVAGEFACLVAAALYGAGSVYARRFSAYAPHALAAGQTAAATLLLLPPTLLAPQSLNILPPSAGAMAALFALGAFSTALAYLLYFRVLARAGATNTSLVTFLIPVSAILLGAVLLGERLEPHQFAGMAAIAVGLIAIDGRVAQGLLGRRRWRDGPDEN